MKKKSIQDLKGKALGSKKLKHITGGDLNPNDLPIGGGGRWDDLVMM